MYTKQRWIMQQQAVALITGGSSGIGFAIAKQMASKGYRLLIISNQEIELAQCKTEIESEYKVVCHTLFKDLTDTNAAQEIFEYCDLNYFDVEVLVNNAGILVFGEALTVPLTRTQTILHLHMHTPVLLCRLFGERMMLKKSGYILNVSSISSVMPYPGISIYGPTKTFIRFFTRALRNEMKGHQVNVTCLIPGATATALYDPKRVNLDLAKKLGIMHNPDFVAKKALDALFSNKAECIPGWLNKITVFVLPLVPSRVIQFIHQKTDWVQKGNQSLG